MYLGSRGLRHPPPGHVGAHMLEYRLQEGLPGRMEEEEDHLGHRALRQVLLAHEQHPLAGRRQTQVLLLELGGPTRRGFNGVATASPESPGQTAAKVTNKLRT